MGDSILSGIDRLFDSIDRAVDASDRVLNRSKHTEEKLRAGRTKRPAVIDVAETTRKTPKKTAHASALSRKPHFYIVESISPSGTLFVVTDGGNARTECSTREFAEKILRALEAG